MHFEKMGKKHSKMSKSNGFLMASLPHTKNMSVQFEHPARLKKINSLTTFTCILKSSVKSD